VGLGLLLFSIYLLTASGHLYAVDERQIYSLTEAIATRGSFDIDADAEAPPQFSTYGPGQSFAALPFFWLGSAVAFFLPEEARPWAMRAVTLWFNPAVTATLAACVYLAGRRIAGKRAALLAALAYGLATPALPHARTFFSEPLNALLWFGAFLLIWRPCEEEVRIQDSGYRRTSSAPLWAFALSGLLAGLAPTVKIQAGIVLPLLALFAVVQAQCSGGFRTQDSGFRRSSGEARSSHSSMARQPRFAMLAWMVGVLLPLLALAAYNTLLFGGPLRTGYGGNIWANFTAPFWEGFGGQLWGLRRGLLWCAPLLLLALPGFVALWRRDRAVTTLCIGILLSQLLFYATWYAWDGAGGPRFLNVALPFLCLPLAALDDGHRRPWLRPTATVLALITVPIQVGALAINMNQLFLAPEPSRMQTLAHMQLLGERAERLYERHFAPGRVVMLRGFSNTEGGDALLPRWALPEAKIVVRPPLQTSPLLRLEATTCFVLPTPTPLQLRLNGVTIADAPGCPQRVYRLLLPAERSELMLTAPPWRPGDAGIDRDETLGMFLTMLNASTPDQLLTLVGDRLPFEPFPIGARAIDRQLSDPRNTVLDFWWAYLPRMPLSEASRLFITLIWSSAALLAAIFGVKR
jgi:hypothetical protein